jgi:hypothetical protein
MNKRAMLWSLEIVVSWPVAPQIVAQNGRQGDVALFGPMVQRPLCFLQTIQRRFEVHSLMPHGQMNWPEKAREIVFHAHVADKYRQRFKKAHPLWGNGTLSAITSKNRYKRIPNKTDYLRALKCVIKAVEEMHK